MDEFKRDGLWWLPDMPENRVPGTLEFSPDSGAALDLLGSLKDPGDHFAAFQRGLTESEVILGIGSGASSPTATSPA